MENAFSTNISQRKLNFEDYTEITQEYPIYKFNKNVVEKMKIRYINPDDYNKQLEVISSDPIIQIRTPNVNINYKSNCYIRMTFNIPDTPAFYTCYIAIRDLKTNEIEEVLKIPIEVLDDND